MAPGIVSYETPDAAVIDTDASANVLEIILPVSEQPFDIDGGITANAQTIKREIPGPVLRLNIGDTAIVRLIKDLPHPSGIHRHGIELREFRRRLARGMGGLAS
jgi:FtsP/CotA-like multicopper oxidase with cupredoxin domain